MKYLKELTKKIQEEIPEIMELKFGCRVIRKIGNQYDSLIILWKSESLIGSNKGETSYNCTINSKNGPSGMTSISNNYLGEIIGRPITLEDVLIVLDLRNKCSKFNESNRQVCWCLYNIGKLIMIWIPNKPLNEQPQETITFLNNLIQN